MVVPSLAWEQKLLGKKPLFLMAQPSSLTAVLNKKKHSAR